MVCGTPGGRIVLLEVKVPGAVLNARELAWHIEWCGWPVHTVRTVEEALEATR